MNKKRLALIIYTGSTLYIQINHKYNDAMYRIRNTSDNGSANGWMVATIGLILLTSIVTGLAIWSFMGYNDQKTNVDNKIATAVNDAKNAQAVKDEAKFFERDKEPNREFVGPTDYGRVTFNYPKTWSVFVNKDLSIGDTYEAYLNPVSVPPISSTQQYALRVLIESKDYDKAIASYDYLVKKGDLTATSVTADGNNGTRLDGSFSKDIRGSAVIFKIRDKTLTIRTDANTFKADFDKLVSTIKFNQ